MFVSVLTVTYNRSRFIPDLIKYYTNQDYPHDQMEWLILDDGDPKEQAKTKALFDAVTLPNIRYIQTTGQKPMGYKLNYLTSLCRGEVIVIMDDDDIYPPMRISSAVAIFVSNPTTKIAGCSKVYMYFEEDNTIYVAGPYHNKHALHCTMAYRASYLLNHRYDDREICAVENVFTNNFTEPMYQLNPSDTILHVVHSSNTFQKKRSVANLHPTSWTKSTFFASV